MYIALKCTKVHTQPVYRLVPISIQVESSFYAISFHRWCLLWLMRFQLKGEHTLTSDTIIIITSSSSLNYSSGFYWPRIKGLYQCVKTRRRRVATKQRHVCVHFVFGAQNRSDSTKHQLLPAQVKRPAPEKPSILTWKQPLTEQSRVALMRLQWHLVVIPRYCIALYSLRSHTPLFFLQLNREQFYFRAARCISSLY